MKFDLSDRITGADLCPNVLILSFSRHQLDGVLSALGDLGLIPDAFSVQKEQVTAAVILPEGITVAQLNLPADVSVEENCFRLLLRGRRLDQSRGLGGTWEALLKSEGIPVLFSCADTTGIVQYLPDRARPAILSLLNSTFSIRVV